MKQALFILARKLLTFDIMSQQKELDEKTDK